MRDAACVLFTTTEEMMLADHAFAPWQCRSAVTGYGVARPELSENFDRLSRIETLTGRYPRASRGVILFCSCPACMKRRAPIWAVRGVRSIEAPDARHRACAIAGPAEHKIADALTRMACRLGITGDVVWTGPLYGNDKWNTMRAAEVCVLPSHQENFGISVVEALACGLPVLVSNKVNIWREIEIANAGLVAEDTVVGTDETTHRMWAARTTEQKREMEAQCEKRVLRKNFDIAVTSDSIFWFRDSGPRIRVPAIKLL